MKQAPLAEEPQYLPGITLRSVAASLLGMLVMVVVLVFGETVDGSGWFYSMHILAFPAVAAFLGLFGLVAGARVLFRIRLLTRAELVCVFFCLLIAVPVMGMGFWTNFIWLSSTIPSQGDFGKIDAVSDTLWPHGPNLFDSGFSKADGQGMTRQVTEYEEGLAATLPVLTNASSEGASWVRLRVPLERDGRPFLTLGERYLLSVLARGNDLAPDAILYCRVYYDDHTAFDVEPFSQPQPAAKVTFLHKKGFQRFGVYGTEFDPIVKDHIDVEFRLVGKGTLALADPKLMSVAAFESLFTARQSVSEAEYRQLRPSERSAFVVKPDSFWSRRGLLTLLGGYVPIRDWVRPVAAWSLFIALLLLATFAVALIMRRQWIKNERYPLPLARIPSALLGIDDGDSPTSLPSIWKNRTAWLGFSLTFLWCLLRAWHAYNPDVPNTEILVQLKPYFDDSGWGQMWNSVSLSVSAIVLSIAIFMELNVLLSLVLGFFLFRSLHWVGEAYGWNIANTGKIGMGAYPYGDEQMISAYITYGLLTLLFTRKYLWQVLKKAFKGNPADSEPALSEDREPISYRVAFILLVTAFVGALAWAHWVGIRPAAMAVLFGVMTLLGFVSMKLRTECGTPFAWFTPGTRLLIPLLGGMTFFGAQGTMFSSWTSLGMILLFIVPGLQLEFIEVARRARIQPRHIVYTLALGIAGGMLIGGWFFLSSMYGIGSNNAGMGYWFTARPWEFYPYIECERVADAAVSGAQQASTGGINPSTWGYVGGALATALVTILRQWFPGFWFHPIAVVLGATADGLGMQMYWSFNLWGSLLLAWAIRFTTLKLGGAAAVRNKLFPFFIGVFVAAVLAQILVFGLNGFLYFFDPTVTRQGIML